MRSASKRGEGRKTSEIMNCFLLPRKSAIRSIVIFVYLAHRLLFVLQKFAELDFHRQRNLAQNGLRQSVALYLCMSGKWVFRLRRRRPQSIFLSAHASTNSCVNARDISETDNAEWTPDERNNPNNMQQRCDVPERVLNFTICCNDQSW